MTRELPDPAKDGALAPADAVADRWATLRAATPARIGLGRSGDAMPMGAVLAFQQAHAAARDAVHAALDPAALEAALRPHPVLHVESAAPDRATYLKRPDLGRRLCDGAAALLAAAGHGFDIVFVVADGLSATAVQAHAAAVLRCCLARTTGFSIAPLVIARQARVALGDPVGEALGARLSVVLIGERPGLSVSDSLGLYLTYDPRPGRRDAERNCISNVHHRGGLSYEEAADRLAWLAREALSRKLTGVALKDDGGPAQIAATP